MDAQFTSQTRIPLDSVGLKLPMVSIIITNYNYGQYLTECLSTVVAQSYPEIECVIVDDCSTDDSADIAQAYLDHHNSNGLFRLVRHEQNMGQMAAFKTGLKHTTGDFVVFLDADDLLFEDFVTTHVKVHMNERHVGGFSCSDNVQFGPQKQVLSLTFGMLQWYEELQGQTSAGRGLKMDAGEKASIVQESNGPIFFPPDQYRWGHWCWSATSAMMFRRSVLELIMPADTDFFRICADFYLVVFSQAIGGSFILPSVHGAYRRHGSNSYSCNPLISTYAHGGPQSRHPSHDESRKAIVHHMTRNKERFLDILGDQGFPRVHEVFSPGPKSRFKSGLIKKLNSLSTRFHSFRHTDRFIQLRLVGFINQAKRLVYRFLLQMSIKLGVGFYRVYACHLIKASKLFSNEFYIEQLTELSSGGARPQMKPIQHFLIFGLGKGLNPNLYFNTDFYLKSYPQARLAGLNPLLHYFLFGADRGYNPSPEFDTEAYLSSNPDVRAMKVNPLSHYIHYGSQEGRKIRTANPVPVRSHLFLEPPTASLRLQSGVQSSKIFTTKDRLGAKLLSRLGIIGVPKFIIIGAQKCGTSSLSEWLDQHYQIDIVGNPEHLITTEFHFFTDNRFWNKGRQWYLSHFPGNCVCGEKTPDYIRSIDVHERMHQTLPEAKLIISLRNPVKRAFSAYQHFMRDLPESKSWGWLLPGESYESNLRAEEEIGFTQGLVMAGFYIDQIENLLRYYKRDQIHFIIFERLIENPQQHLDDLCQFIGVDQNFNYYLDPKNVGSYKNKMAPETYAWLDTVFRPYNERLYDFLGYEIEEWKLPADSEIKNQGKRGEGSTDPALPATL